MKVLYIDYNMYGKNGIINAFKALGHEVSVADYPLLYGEESKETEGALAKEFEENDYDSVFTSNYYPMVSNLCEKNNIKYISWTYDSPRITLYDKSIKNRCNYAFIFDSYECANLRNKGADTVYYMPLAIDPEIVDSVKISGKDKEVFSSEVSMVCSLYNEEHNLFDRMKGKLSDYDRGFLEAVLSAQKNLFGGSVLDEVVCGNAICQKMYEAMPYRLADGSLADLGYVYANYFLARKAAEMQRLQFIEEISKRHEMKVYTPGDLSLIPTVKHMGTVDYNTDMYKVFRLSKINVNINLPSIHTGIPLRAIDIMGAGGFLLASYEEDYMGLFEPGIDFVFFTSLADALDKIEYYLAHEDERKQIADNAGKKIHECFTYYTQIKNMLDIVTNEEK